MSFPRIITYRTNDFFFLFFWEPNSPLFPNYTAFNFQNTRTMAQRFTSPGSPSHHKSCNPRLSYRAVLCCASHPIHATKRPRPLDAQIYLHIYTPTFLARTTSLLMYPLSLPPSPPIPNWTLQLDLPLSIWLLGECIGILRAVMDLCLSLHLS